MTSAIAAATPRAAGPGRADASPLLRVSGLGVRFGSLTALTDAGLTVGEGELVALAGEPGAGKTTLVRCIAGDITPSAGRVTLAGDPVPALAGGARRGDIGVVWSDLALCENLDVAGNLLLGQESRRLMFSHSRFHSAAASLLRELEIPVRDTTQMIGSLSPGQRTLVGVAKAMGQGPRLVVLDEPTASLGVLEARQVEDLITSLRARGTAILLATRDIDQMFRLADRIVVLHRGRVVGNLTPSGTHPDDVAALLSGQEIDSSARGQLSRLHGLAGRLVSADPSSSLALILSALGAALGSESVCIHVVRGGTLVCEGSLGFAPEQIARWSRLDVGPAGGPAGRAAAHERLIVEEDLRADNPWGPPGEVPGARGLASSWSVPVMGPTGASAVITVFQLAPGPPQRDQLDLLTLYAGYVSSAVERDRLLDQATARNRVLETIREMLETLAGPVLVTDGLVIALQSLRRGLRADEVVLLSLHHANERVRGYAGPLGSEPATMSERLRTAAQDAIADTVRAGSARGVGGDPMTRMLAVPFLAPAGPTVLVASWDAVPVTEEETALIENAAHSLRLALEREEAGLAHQEAVALRRSRELQREFLSRLSHELRTPLTAIRGYASSLMQPDVTWDGDSQERFLDRIAAESARLGRLVDDLLDFSAIEAGVMRLQPDWCDLRLVIEAAVSCLPDPEGRRVSINCDAALPAVWADHDRLEQVFVNLLSNAVRHNPPATRVAVVAAPSSTGADSVATGPTGVPAEVKIRVVDDGAGLPEELARAPFGSPGRRRSRSAGAGLGLSIARGIVQAHGGRIALEPVAAGTSFAICLPIEGGGVPEAGSDAQDAIRNGEGPLPAGAWRLLASEPATRS